MMKKVRWIIPARQDVCLQHHIPLPPACIFFTPRHYDQNACSFTGEYLLLTSALRIAIGRCALRTTQSYSIITTRMTSTPDSVPAQHSNTNRINPIEATHYLRRTVSEAAAGDRQTPHRFGCIAVSSQLSHGCTVTHPSRFGMHSRFNGASFRGRGHRCTSESYQSAKLLLSDVATYRTRIGSRPMGLGTSEAAN
jgi:hypothetical protein